MQPVQQDEYSSGSLTGFLLFICFVLLLLINLQTIPGSLGRWVLNDTCMLGTGYGEVTVNLHVTSFICSVKIRSSAVCLIAEKRSVKIGEF